MASHIAAIMPPLFVDSVSACPATGSGIGPPSGVAGFGCPFALNVASPSAVAIRKAPTRPAHLSQAVRATPESLLLLPATLILMDARNRLAGTITYQEDRARQPAKLRKLAEDGDAAWGRG